jgi:hypothetical protein
VISCSHNYTGIPVPAVEGPILVALKNFHTRVCHSQASALHSNEVLRGCKTAAGISSEQINFYCISLIHTVCTKYSYSSFKTPQREVNLTN